jgi:preprotein translocase subunit SecY
MSELGRRIGFTIGALLIFRIGTYIPLPGMDASIWSQLFQKHGTGILGAFNMAGGGAVQRLAVLALGILPYINAAILMQIVWLLSARLRNMVRRGERGRARFVTSIRILTLIMAFVQGYGVAAGLEEVDNLVTTPGPLFEITTALTLAAGTMLLVWLSEQITVRGVGNGLALLVAVGIIAELPSGFAKMFEMVRMGYLSEDAAVVLLVLAGLAVALAVAVEGARRNLQVQYPARELAGRQFAPQLVPLSLKLNPAGALLPSLIVSWVLAIAMQGRTLEEITAKLAGGQLIYGLVFAILVVLAVLLYAARLIDPEQWGSDLEKAGATVEGMSPGEPTVAHLDHVISRVTLVGGLYLAALLVIPALLIARYQLPFYFDGAAMLIVVCAVMDLVTQVKGFARTGRT